MLVITRVPGQSVLIGDDVRITVTSVGGGQIKFAIEAPSDTVVLRQEVAEKPPQAARSTADTESGVD